MFTSDIRIRINVTVISCWCQMIWWKYFRNFLSLEYTQNGAQSCWWKVRWEGQKCLASKKIITYIIAVCVGTISWCVKCKDMSNFDKGAKWQAGGDSVMLWAMFCQKTLVPGIHTDTTFDRYHLPKHCYRPIRAFMATLFSNDGGLFVPDTKAQKALYK